MTWGDGLGLGHVDESGMNDSEEETALVVGRHRQ